jgi:hypothetical protein
MHRAGISLHLASTDVQGILEKTLLHPRMLEVQRSLKRILLALVYASMLLPGGSPCPHVPLSHCSPGWWH